MLKGKKWLRMVKNQENGITLIALVVTIIILLILAGITVGAITGDNGIIGNAGKAKEETEITNEKEIIEKATVQAMENNKYGNIEENELQEQLDKETGEGKTEATDVGNEYEVVFHESNRYYTVDKNGNLEGAYEIVEDKYPGDMTVGKDGGVLDGTEEKPYEIWCIEDLVEWSKNYSKYQNSNIILCRDLNFKSRNSYNDSSSIDYGDINQDEQISELITELTTGLGFYPIANFSGTFDGKNYELRNLYVSNSENRKMNIGFFSRVSSGAVVQNIHISGEINATCYDAGGIVGFITENNINLSNNSFEGKVESKGNGGGIIGATNNMCLNILVSKCYNNAEIIGINGGGIIAKGSGLEILNCANKGNITVKTGGGSAGGIVGKVDSANGADIYNCFNTGDIINDSTITYSSSGGIVGNVTANGKYVNIANCYNTGKTTAQYSYITNFSGGILGGFWYNTYETNIKNCYYDQIKSNRSVGGSKEEHAQKLTLEQLQGKELIQINKESAGKLLVEILNEYKDSNPIDINNEPIDTSNWLYWKQGKSGYPIFE